MLNIVIPMAGLGTRFTQVGYTIPKPLIPIHEVPMIKFVIANIQPESPHRFIFICQYSHLREYALQEKLKVWAPGSAVIALDGVTEGAACTVLTARELIGNDEPLMVANSDQYVSIDINRYLADMNERRLDGLIMTMDADDPKWSFAATDADGMVTRVVEKQVISRHATVGIYNFRRGEDFVVAADDMIRRNLRVNNEFYVAPVYNQMIGRGGRIGIYDVGRDGDGMYGLGTPPDLESFSALPLSRRLSESIR